MRRAIAVLLLLSPLLSPPCRAAGSRLDRLDAPSRDTWSYASAPASGGLLFASNSGSQRRGWERVRHAGGRGYVLENFTLGSPAPAVTFAPTSRLVRIYDN